MWKIILLTKPLVTLFKKLRTNLRGAAVAQRIHLRFHPAALGSNPKHTI